MVAASLLPSGTPALVPDPGSPARGRGAAMRACLALLALGVSSCAYASASRTAERPNASLLQELIAKEEATGLVNGYLIEQASVFSGGPAPTFQVSRLDCTDKAAGRFDCRFALATRRGSSTQREQQRRTVWRMPEGGWTTNVIEELCDQQKRELGAERCQAIVDE